ncbi:MAG: FlgO family outer membrane protein [Treponema sp.]
MKKIALILCALLLSVAVFSQSKPVVVVAPFDAKGVAQDEVDVITELFTAEYANTGTARVVDRNSFDKIRAQLKFQSSDWSNADKVAQLGKALNANHVVVGQLIKFRAKIAVTIKVIDVNTTTILASYTEKVGDIESLLDELPKICAELSGKMIGGHAKKYKIGDEGEAGGIVFYIKGEYVYEVIFLNTSASYEDAKQIAHDYIFGGYDDWRLPKDNEITSICYNICSKRRDLWGNYCMTEEIDLERYALIRLSEKKRADDERRKKKKGYVKQRYSVSPYARCTNICKLERGWEDDRFEICLVRVFKQESHEGI